MTELSLRTLLILLLGYPFWASAANLSRDAPEETLSQQLTQMESATESEPARRWLEQLADYQEQARQPHPEHPALDLPRYALAARAQILLQRWDEQRAFQNMQSDPAQRSKATADGPELRARIRWIEQASVTQINAFRSSVGHDALPEAILLALAAKQNNHADNVAIAKQGQSRHGLDHLRQCLDAASTTAEQRKTLLHHMRSNPAYRGSVASINAAWLQKNPKQLQNFIQNWQHQAWTQEQLETALRVRPPALTQQLQNALQNTDTASLAAWGLWQLQTAESRQILLDYVDSASAIPQLAQELDQWLR